jgi:hypothetical protein
MKKTLLVLAMALLAVLFVACASEPADEPAAASAAPAAAAPVIAETKPVETVAFEGKELKIELEAMSLTNIEVFDDKNASGGKAVKIIGDDSTAIINVTIPKGDYTGLVNELSPGGWADAFYVFVDETPFRCFPSDPPIGDWELTERTPMAISIPEDKTVQIKITPHSAARKGETGMSLDYLIITKD